MKRLGTKVSILTLLFILIFGFNAICEERARVPDEDLWADEVGPDLDNPDHPPMRSEEMFEGRRGRGRPGREDPGNGGHRGQRMRDMQKKHEEFIKWLKENYPDDANELSEIKEKNPELYMRRIMRSVRKYGPIMKVSKENPELAEVMKENEKLKDQRDEILEKFQTAKPEEQEALKAQLTEIVRKRFDLIVKRKMIQHDRLLKKLERLKKNIENSEAEVEKWKASKQEKVDERVKDLLDKTEKFHWD